MPQRTMDDIMDVLEPVQDRIKRVIALLPARGLADLIQADADLQALLTELSQGARDRAKRRRQRDRARELRDRVDVPLWGDESDGE